MDRRLGFFAGGYIEHHPLIMGNLARIVSTQPKTILNPELFTLPIENTVFQSQVTYRRRSTVPSHGCLHPLKILFMHDGGKQQPAHVKIVDVEAELGDIQRNVFHRPTVFCAP